MTGLAGGAIPARHDAYLRKETVISVVINATLSLLFFLLVFGVPATVPLQGSGGYAFDFIPQSFMIALMSALVPGAITAARLRGGAIAGKAEATGALLRRSLLMALIAGLVGGGIAGLLPLLSTAAPIPLIPALIAKVLYGALLASVVTPIGLRHALRLTKIS